MSQTKRKSNRTGSENGKDRQGDKRTRAPDGMSNVECGANYMSTDKRCEMEFEDTRSRKKRKCRNIAERILRCNHMVCGPCFELRNRCSASKQEVYFCPFCDYRTLNSQVKTIKSVHGDDQKGNCNTIFFLEQEKGNISKTSPSPSPNSDQCVIERCKSTAVVFILSCKHNFCSSCFCRFHKPLVILEDFCCIKCYVCKMEMWLRNDEMQEKAKATGERFSNIGMQHIGMADANVEIDQYFEMENFNIDWKFKGYYRPQFKITEWDDVNKPECSKTVVSHNKDGVYTYECNISKGTFFFKLASYRHNKEDKYSIWIGPIERIKVKPPSMDGKLEITGNDSNCVHISWDCVEAPKYVKIYKYIVQMKTYGTDREWRDCQSVEYFPNEAKVTDLDYGHHYSFRVKVKSSIGDGVENATIETYKIASKNKGPSKPTNLEVTVNKEMTSACLIWRRPIVEGYLSLLQYKIEIIPISTKNVVICQTKEYNLEDKVQCNIDISQLLDGVYETQVKAENSYGLSDGATAIFTKIRNEKVEDKPNEPLEVKVQLTSQTSIKVSWYRGYVKTSGPVRDFVIENRNEGIYSWDIVKTVANDPTKYWHDCTIPDLKERTIYYFRVKSRNEKGESEGRCASKIKTGQKETENSSQKEIKEETSNATEEYKTKLCFGCLKEVKALETRLSCSHKFCEVCSKELFENAVESENGVDILFYWECNYKDCESVTEENCVEFIGNTLSQIQIQENRKRWLEEKAKTLEKDEDVSDNAIAECFDVTTIRGLPNVGMTCYANCIFQILGQTPYLLDHLEVLIKEYRIDREISVTGQLQKLLHDINGVTTNVYKRSVEYNTVVRLVETVCLKDEKFVRGEQADSHSFMMTLFNAIEEETFRPEAKKQDEKCVTNKNEKEKEEKEVRQVLLENTFNDSDKNNVGGPVDLFKGYMYNKITCQKCLFVEESEKQMFYSLLVPVEESFSDSSWSVSDGLKVMLKEEFFDDNELPCEKCNKKEKGSSDSSTKMTKQQTFAKLPNVLILQLGKFKQIHVSLAKMNQNVDYPFTLKIKDEVQKTNDTTYSLYGVALHVGSLRYGGHYAAYVKRNMENRDHPDRDVWYYCSDSVINMVATKHVLNDPRASILFYRRIA